MQPSTTSTHHGANCFGCGPENPAGIKCHFPFEEKTGEVRFKFSLNETHEGAPGVSHGGVISSIVDEAMGVLCFHLGHFAMTDQLYVSYHKATPLFEELDVRAWVTLVRKRRLYTKATIHGKSGELYISGKGRFYSLPPRMLPRVFRGNYREDYIEEMAQIMQLNQARGKAIRKRLREEKLALR